MDEIANVYWKKALTYSVGEIFGFVSAYLLFTTMLFFVLTLLNKIPESWTYFHIFGITSLIILTGVFIGRFLND